MVYYLWLTMILSEDASSSQFKQHRSKVLKLYQQRKLEGRTKGGQGKKIFKNLI
jgi:hypothetical protein